VAEPDEIEATRQALARAALDEERRRPEDDHPAVEPDSASSSQSRLTISDLNVLSKSGACHRDLL
jgi:hypothetical protein